MAQTQGRTEASKDLPILPLVPTEFFKYGASGLDSQLDAIECADEVGSGALDVHDNFDLLDRRGYSSCSMVCVNPIKPGSAERSDERI